MRKLQDGHMPQCPIAGDANDHDRTVAQKYVHYIIISGSSTTSIYSTPAINTLLHLLLSQMTATQHLHSWCTD